MASLATQRLITPEPVDGQIMFIVSSLGIVMNMVLWKVLSQARASPQISPYLPISPTHLPISRVHLPESPVHLP